MSSRSEIYIKNYVWRSAYLVTGHYEFEILVRSIYEDSQVKEKIYYRRFSEIEWLHNILLETNPGCRVPSLPEKTIWTNLGVNNDTFLDKRKKDVEVYLNYINSHKYLSKNPYYQEFISDLFDKSRKAEIQNTKKLSIMEIVRNTLPGFKQS